MKAYETTKIGHHRGNPRLWLQGRKASRAGFHPGKRFRVRQDETRSMLVLEIDADGERGVSRKIAGAGELPVIDINSAEDLAVLTGFTRVRVISQKLRIVILPCAVELAKKERLARLRAKIAAAAAISVGSISHGGGILDHALHSGMRAAGVKSRLAFANDIRPELLEHASAHNDAWDDETVSLAAPMQLLAFDAWAMDRIDKVEVLCAGIPCSGASRSGRAKRGAGHAEEHPEVGHLIAPFLAIVAKTQPAVVLVENVVPYRTSASMFILRHQLRDLGYQVHEAVLHASEWNVLENRERLCMVATTEGLDFDFALLSRPVKVERRIAEILETVAPDDDRWSTMAGLLAKQDRDREKGNSFKMQIVTADSTSCPTITKGYAKVRSTDPKLRSSHDPSLLRQFTLLEHARLKGVPAFLIKGLGLTFGHELLGQSVCYQPFEAVGELLGEFILADAGVLRAPARLAANELPNASLASVLTTALQHAPVVEPAQLSLLE
ncbi:hypothetical protein BFJ63_vAg13538 [Fusarium oxysporum f. sp. narcissi]|jgi:DNA (cytosine-5)-methyltransferase 1|uniref:DNA (cytosine-5-)-methyltransferase n=2 Tax=Fusarium TaxID=5506 RepID=A0A4Q2V8M8_FUSOX|nr:hypothetical protein BFJ72_g14287 [Fusarium proliferatum]RYC83591.1 hypothetical protein BFJ63_vAg13538 [Fusarium oxysporum f. sp. narcissi]